MAVRLVQVSASPRLGSTTLKPASWSAFTIFQDVILESNATPGCRIINVEDTAVSERMGMDFESGTGVLRINKVDSGGAGSTTSTMFTDTGLGLKRQHLRVCLTSDGTTLTGYHLLPGGDVVKTTLALGTKSAAPNAMTFGGTNAGGGSAATIQFHATLVYDALLTDTEVAAQLRATTWAAPVYRQGLIGHFLFPGNASGLNILGTTDLTVTGTPEAATDDSPSSVGPWWRTFAAQVSAGGNTMTVAATVPVATAAIALASTDSLTIAATVPVATSAASLASTDNLSIAATAPVATMATTLVLTDYTVTVAAVVPVATSAVALASTDALTVAATAPAPTCSAALTSTDFLTVAGTSPVATMAATVTAGSNNVAVDATVPPPTCVAAMASADAFSVAATVPGSTMAANLAADLVLVIAAPVPPPTVVANLTVPAESAPVASPWAKLMKPRYARWRRRRDGIA